MQKKLIFLADLIRYVKCDLRFFQQMTQQWPNLNTNAQLQIEHYCKNIQDTNLTKFIGVVFCVPMFDIENEVRKRDHEPSIEIDFVWHAHMQHPAKYKRDILGCFVEHHPR